MINALPVYRVKSRSVNAAAQTRAVGKQATTPASPFWQRLVQAWAKQGLPTSQNGVANKLGDMSQGSTRRWYTGDGFPEIETLVRIARLGRCSLHWLLTGEGPEAVAYDPDTVDLLRHWNALLPEGRAAVLRMAKMEHAGQFTGDPAARAAYEQSLVEYTRRHQVHDRKK